MKHRHRHRRDREGSPLWTVVRYFVVLAVLAGFAGATWLALTPLDAPTRQVVREVPHERFAPG